MNDVISKLIDLVNRKDLEIESLRSKLEYTESLLKDEKKDNEKLRGKIKDIENNMEFTPKGEKK